MGTKALTKGQMGARALLVVNLQMQGIKLTDAEYRVVILGLPFEEWPEPLKAKAGRLGELVRIEDERAASPSPGR